MRAVPTPAFRSGEVGTGTGSPPTWSSAMEITGIISALIIGLVIGALGRLVVPGRQRIPIWLTIVIGVVAALIGTGIATLLGVADTAGIDWIELGIQVALAALGVAATAGTYARKK